MKRKIFMMLTTMALLAAAALITQVEAQPSFTIYGYVDKTQYMLGDMGTLRLWIYNDGTVDLILKNVTIEYPWYSPFWGGNETIKDIDVIISPKGNWSTTRTFTVPSDGRATGGPITIRVGTDKILKTGYVSLNVATAPAYLTLKDMDKLVTLLTIQAILVIVAAAIIATAVFFTRKPPVTPQEKA